MRTETKTYTVYKYEELSESAKENVRKWYLEGQEPCIFTEDCRMMLNELFPNSDLKVEYSLAYCQGDGLNIYGDIDLGDVLERIANDFTEKERKFIKWACRSYGRTYNMPSNHRYCYCICSRNDFTEDWYDGMKQECMRGIPEDTLDKFNRLVGIYLDKLCGELEEDGYNFFYEISDEDLRDACEVNEWEFDEDGNIW